MSWPLKLFILPPPGRACPLCSVFHTASPLVSKWLAQLFLFCCGIPFILVHQAFPITCLVTLADRAWGRGQAVVIGYKCWGSNRVCLVFTGTYERVLSASLATPGGMEASASILPWTVFLPGCWCNKMCWVVKEVFLVRGMSRLSFAVTLREVWCFGRGEGMVEWTERRMRHLRLLGMGSVKSRALRKNGRR